jgi:16S rRNA (uracil1498-N3)-methyltransferase
MGHVPHLFLPGPWESDRIEVSPDQGHHLEKVLRLTDGHPVGYTDGKGLSGSGGYLAGGIVTRGQESVIPRPSELTVVAAPPDNRDRARFLVEKLSEMGVAELRFLETEHGQGRPPRHDRAQSWAVSGLEQSRGAWLIRIPDGTVTLAGLKRPYVVCDPTGRRELPSARTVVIGPEGGWAMGEVPDDAQRWDLGDTVLRLETAALVAAARLI